MPLDQAMEIGVGKVETFLVYPLEKNLVNPLPGKSENT